jgi:hypothetical protein
MPDSRDVRKLAIEVSRYLRLNPLASDTVEGISAWWLRTRNAKELELLRALEWLCREGVIEAHQGADGRTRYRRTNPAADIDQQLQRLLRAPE